MRLILSMERIIPLNERVSECKRDVGQRARRMCILGRGGCLKEGGGGVEAGGRETNSEEMTKIFNKNKT